MPTIRYTTSTGERTISLPPLFTVGRDAVNDLALSNDLQVSARHACVRAEGDGHVVEDLGSRNGTYLDRGSSIVRVQNPERLQPNDVIRIGSTRMVYEIDAVDLPPVSARPAPAERAPVGPTIEQPTEGFKATVRGRVIPLLGGAPLPPAAEPPPDPWSRIADLERRVATLEAQIASFLDRS